MPANELRFNNHSENIYCIVLLINILSLHQNLTAVDTNTQTLVIKDATVIPPHALQNSFSLLVLLTSLWKPDADWLLCAVQHFLFVLGGLVV